MPGTPTTVAEYLATLTPERRRDIAAVRATIRKRLPKGYKEMIDYGIISYAVPKSILPETYNGHPLGYVLIGTQKSHCVVHLMGAYGSEKVRAQLDDDFRAAGKKLNMGKGCLRFDSVDDISLDAIGNCVAAVPMKEWIDIYERSRLMTKTGAKKAAKKAATNKKS